MLDGKLVRRVIPNEPGYIPFMGWTPNADTFDILELYPSAVYFEKPYARIKLNRVVIRDVDQGARVDGPDEFEWFTRNSIVGERRKSSRFFTGYSALVLDRAEWLGRDLAFDALLTKATSLMAITDAPLGQTKRTWMLAAELFRTKFRVRGLWSPLKAIPGHVRYLGLASVNTKSPVTRGNGLSRAFILQRDGTGVLDITRSDSTSFSRLFRRGPIRARPPEWTTWRRGENTLVPMSRHPSRFLFDPDTQEIYWIFSVGYLGQVRR